MSSNTLTLTGGDIARHILGLIGNNATHIEAEIHSPRRHILDHVLAWAEEHDVPVTRSCHETFHVVTVGANLNGATFYTHPEDA